MELRDIRSIPSLAGSRVLVRAGLNVPVEDGRVIDDFRVRRLLPTLTYLLKERARVIVIGHLGRSSEVSLSPVANELRKHIPITFVTDLVGERAARAVHEMKEGELVLLENVRNHGGERSRDAQFATTLASYAQYYVNEAFSDSHRDHATITEIPRLIPGYAGFSFMDEVQHLTQALSPVHQSLCVLGGAKFETKEPLIRKFLEVYDRVYVAGALANDFFKAAGNPIGTSLVSPNWHNARELLTRKNLSLPADVVVMNAEGSMAREVALVEADEKIVDIGPKGLFELSDYIANSQFVLWNGPLGLYERGFRETSEDVARTIASSRAYSVVGGGDTAASIARLKLEDRFTFVSTAGGAMLEFLLSGTLPGIEALQASQR